MRVLKFAILLTIVYCVSSTNDTNGDSPGVEDECPKIKECSDGLILPAWTPPAKGATKIIRGTVYLVALLYMFLGVAIIADRFMSAIEVITSQDKRVTVTDKDGCKEVLDVKVWNETIANLTLMALGSSAPEILLSVIEIIGSGFKAGDLGPGTIVGSAAFNLLVIIAVCVIVIPSGESRSIKSLGVFAITAIFSLFAYVWLLLIIKVFSPEEVTIIEALITLLCFPLVVFLAYAADTGLFRHISKGFGYRIISARKSEDVELQDNPAMCRNDHESSKAELINKLIKERKANQQSGDIYDILESKEAQKLIRSRAYYKKLSTNTFSGGKNPMKSAKSIVSRELEESKKEKTSPKKKKLKQQHISFEKDTYVIEEDKGHVEVFVKRTGPGIDASVIEVDFKTAEGTAKSPDDYHHTEGKLTFDKNCDTASIKVPIIDDESFEETEFFHIELSNLIFKENEGKLLEPQFELQKTTIYIVDDDFNGTFQFSQNTVNCYETDGTVEIEVLRQEGRRGRVILPFHYADGLAKYGEDYEIHESHKFGGNRLAVIFENNQSSSVIKVNITNDDEYEKKEDFRIILDQPELIVNEDQGSFDTKIRPDGKVKAEDKGLPRLATQMKDTSCTIIIIEDSKRTEDKKIVSKLTDFPGIMSKSTWADQFHEALTLPGGDGEEESSCCSKFCDYVMFVLSFPWKLMFALVPPPGIWNGWACFLVSITLIGMMTAVIGDIATHFGCTVGLVDTVTAISLVALGTSVPDTFASKVAAVNEEYADSSVGNVTGSNAVNVFLGIGVAWTLAAFYHLFAGTKGGFVVPAGSLAFSVTIFLICAVVCIAILMIRRRFTSGELGGSVAGKYATGIFFILLWVFYIAMSSLVAYCVIEGF